MLMTVMLMLSLARLLLMTALLPAGAALVADEGRAALPSVGTGALPQSPGDGGAEAAAPGGEGGLRRRPDDARGGAPGRIVSGVRFECGLRLSAERRGLCRWVHADAHPELSDIRHHRGTRPAFAAFASASRSPPPQSW